MPISSETTGRIAKTLIGDEGDFYPYITGPQIVRLFNSEFGFKDVYQAGAAPTRWKFAEEKISTLFSHNHANKFFNVILGYRFMMRSFQCPEVDAHTKARVALEEMNRLLGMDGYSITGPEGSYRLVLINDDLVLLGEGGFARAYRQKSTGLVVKKLTAESMGDERCRHRFKREFEIMKGLGDVEGVLKVYEFDEGAGTYTMEEGEQTLADFVKNPLREETKAEILKQVISTMATIHDRGIIHRDISPNNIFILRGTIKIADFGLGKNLDILGSYQTRDTKQYGQLYYCSPEQFILLKDGDKRSDVFALGRLINYVIAGNPLEFAHPFRPVSTKATSQDPNNRFQDARALLRAFEQRIRINADSQFEERISSKAKTGVLDNEVSDWIMSMSVKDLCRKLVAEEWFMAIAGRFACDSSTNAGFIVDAMGEGMEAACRNSFEDNDPFAEVAYAVINSAAEFDVRERACLILAYVARYVNRFRAQRLIDDLVSEGIDPTLEQVLEGHPSAPHY